MKCDNKGCFGSSFSFCFSHFLRVYRLDDFAVSLAFRFHHGVAVDVHAGGDLRVPQKLLRTDHLCVVHKKASLIRIHRDGSWSAVYIGSYKMKSNLFDRFLAVQMIERTVPLRPLLCAMQDAVDFNDLSADSVYGQKR